ncbi:MAG: hypothetical protein ACM3O3_12595 [Syntrophothermus sp.]
MYNQCIKEEFISDLKGKYAAGTIRLYRQLFNKAEETEEVFNKDINEMNFKEARELLKGYPNRSVNMFLINCSMLRTYKSWCLARNIKIEIPNYFSFLNRKDADDYVRTQYIKKKVISYETLLNFEHELLNYQDYVLLVLAFVGVSGKESIEIRELKVSDVHTNYIQLHNRIIKINEKIYSIIKNAINEDVYDAGNGISDAKATQRYIHKNEYVVRLSGVDKNEPVNCQLVKGRIDRMQNYIGNNITVTNIKLSGMVYLAKEIIKQKEIILKDDWIKINRVFGFNEINSVNYWSVTKQKCEPYI